ERAQLQLQIVMAGDRVKTVTSEAARAFQKWLKEDGRVRAPQPAARFAFDNLVSNTTPDSVTTNVARLVDGPKLIPGHDGNALEFSGDNELDLKGVGEF